MGGVSSSAGDPSQWLQYFDHKAGGWGRLGDMAVERPYGCGGAAVGTYLYAFGGEADVEPGCTTMCDVATRQMKEVAKPPRALQFCAGVTCGGLVYSLGGRDVALNTRVADVCIYNPDMDSWVDGPALPLGVSSMAAVEHSGCIYACGGRQAVGADLLPSGSLLMLDPRTRSWASLPAMPTPAGNARAAVVAGRMYVPGGCTTDTVLSSMQC